MKAIERRSDTSISRTHVFNGIGALAGAVVAAGPYLGMYLSQEVVGLAMVAASAVNDYLRRTQTKL